MPIFLFSCGGGLTNSFLPTTGGKQTPVIPPPTVSVPLVKLSTDTFTNLESQHATEVEPGAASFGSTIVTAFQVARLFSGGGADIGFAISTDGGATWTSGLLPGLTVNYQGGTAAAASDAVPAYDAKHQMTSSLYLWNHSRFR